MNTSTSLSTTHIASYCYCFRRVLHFACFSPFCSSCFLSNHVESIGFLAAPILSISHSDNSPLLSFVLFLRRMIHHPLNRQQQQNDDDYDDAYMGMRIVDPLEVVIGGCFIYAAFAVILTPSACLLRWFLRVLVVILLVISPPFCLSLFLFARVDTSPFFRGQVWLLTLWFIFFIGPENHRHYGFD